MKVTKQAVSVPRSFCPFDLTISVETQEEAQALHAIFNHTANHELLPLIARNLVKNILSDYYVTKGFIANGITHDEYYRGQKL